MQMVSRLARTKRKLIDYGFYYELIHNYELSVFIIILIMDCIMN